eukprot:931198-Prymnesium_polylepis.1
MGKVVSNWSRSRVDFWGSQDVENASQVCSGPVSRLWHGGRVSTPARLETRRGSQDVGFVLRRSLSFECRSPPPLPPLLDSTVTRSRTRASSVPSLSDLYHLELRPTSIDLCASNLLMRRPPPLAHP